MQNYNNRRYFVKKPVRVSAYQTFQSVTIRTREGNVQANAGDWIITDNNNERHVVNHDVFMATYDRVEDD